MTVGSRGVAESGSSEAGRALPGLIGACSAALFLSLCLPLLTGRVFVYNDLTWFQLPMRHLYQQAIQAGDSVLWTPSIFSGFYMHGEGQTGVFHPLHQLLYRVAPLGAAVNLEILASYVFAFAGMWWFLRRLDVSRAGALFGAMLFAFSGFNLLHHHHINMVAIVAHLPWLLASADVLIVEQRKAPRTLAFAAVAVILGSQVLLGFPQGVWWNVLALAAFSAFRASAAQAWRQLLPCAAAVALGMMLGAIQLFPQIEAAAQSTRTELPRDFALTLSLHPLNLIQLWSPQFFQRGAYSDLDQMLFHEFGIYSGAILQVALIWVWIRRHQLKDRRRLITAVTAFAAVMLALALGQYGGVATLLTYVPVLQSFRAPVRYIVLVQFALTILAAIAIADLAAIARGEREVPAGRRLAAIWIPAALGIVTTVVLNSGLVPYGPRTFAGAAQAVAGVAIVATVTLMVHLATRRVRWAMAALILVTAVDLGLWGIRFIYLTPAQTIDELTLGITPAPSDPAEAYAAAPDRGPYSGDVLVLQGYRLTTGYAGLFPATRRPLDDETALRLSGTRWYFSSDGSRRPARDAAERARFQDTDRAAPMRVVIDRPGYLVVDVEAPARGTLALTERFHPGWSATVAGSTIPVVRVDEDFLGCIVDAGTHRVTLRFMPRSFQLGLGVTVLGAVLLAGVVVARLR